MTIQQLIDELLKYPPTTLVTHRDGENGRADVTHVSIREDYYHPEIEVIELA